MPRRANCAKCGAPIQLGGGSLPAGQATCRTCHTVERTFDPSKCGTPLGRDQHRHRGQAPCDECRRAWNVVSRERGARLRESGWTRPDREPPKVRRLPATCTSCGKAIKGSLVEPLCSDCRGDQPGRNIKISPAGRVAIYDRDGWICQLCSEPVDPLAPTNSRWDATLDHIVPSSKGGDDSPENLRLAHRRCNAVRGANLDAAHVA